MRYKFYTADIFTSQLFGGNQLAVIPDAAGISDERMQQVTREFNYSETVFVLPPETPEGTRRLRIFTPGTEIPFAGHPTVGTAFVLASIGQIALEGAETRVIFEEGVGPVPVLIRAEQKKPTFAQLTVAKLPEIGPPAPSRSALADLLSLETNDLLGGMWSPQAVSCGLPFLFVPVKDRDAVAQARVRLDRWDGTLRKSWAPDVMVFTRDTGEGKENGTIRARVFVPGMGVPEDPATGSACAALGGYLAARDARQDGTLHWTVEQGFEMGRPSILEVEADKAGGQITAIRVGGASVMVAEGEIEIPG